MPEPASLNFVLSASFPFYQLLHTTNNVTMSELWQNSVVCWRVVGRECVGKVFTHLFQVLL